MSTGNQVVSGVSPSTPPQLSGGLYLKGTVIAVCTEEREWDKEKYTQTSVEISDGEKVYSMRHRHDGTAYTPPKLFTQVTVRVNYTATDKGKISVRGVLV